jgi:hypothetical protein
MWRENARKKVIVGIASDQCMGMKDARSTVNAAVADRERARNASQYSNECSQVEHDSTLELDHTVAEAKTYNGRESPGRWR